MILQNLIAVIFLYLSYPYPPIVPLPPSFPRWIRGTFGVYDKAAKCANQLNVSRNPFCSISDFTCSRESIPRSSLSPSTVGLRFIGYTFLNSPTVA